ncbi:hypothetical protein QTP86_003935, partial [Hemibagrus guttatus]
GREEKESWSGRDERVQEATEEGEIEWRFRRRMAESDRRAASQFRERVCVKEPRERRRSDPLRYLEKEKKERRRWLGETFSTAKGTVITPIRTRLPDPSTLECSVFITACVRRQRMGLAAGMAFKTLTRRHGFKVLATAVCPVEECTAAVCPVEECAAAVCPVGECAAVCPVEECAAAVAKLIGTKSIVTAARMNKSVV